MSVGEPLDIAVVGTRTIGLVYGHLWSNAGHRVTWTPPRGRPGGTERQMIISDLGTYEDTAFWVAPRPWDAFGAPDVVVLATGAAAWPAALDAVAKAGADPVVITLGQSPLGLRGVPVPWRNRTVLGFPGVTGHMNDEAVGYVRLVDQPTTFLTPPPKAAPVLARLADALDRQHHATQLVTDDGWFAYRALESLVLSQAIVLAGTAADLGKDPARLRLTGEALREGVGALRAAGVRGLPPGQAVYLHPWARVHWESLTAQQLAGRSGMLAFGAYALHVGRELTWLRTWALALCDEASTPTTRLRALVS